MSTKPEGSKDVLALEAKKAAQRERMAKRWGGHVSIFSDGFTPLPRTFLKYAAHLKPYPLTPTQMVFVAELLYHKWDENMPFPAYATLADRMGISVQYARSTARDLERKGYLKRIKRVGRPNLFDLQPLFDAVAKRVEEEPAKNPARKKRAA
jgi:hypothetical protein